MRKTKTKLTALVMGLTLCLSSVLPVYASQEDRSQELASNVYEEAEDDVEQAIITAQTDYYDGVYAFENWDFDFVNQRIENDVYTIDINVLADMILVREPEANPYYQGLLSAAEEASALDSVSIADIQEAADAYKDMVSEYYMQPYRTGFAYSAEIAVEQDETVIKLYRLVCDGDEEYIREEVKEGDKFIDLATFAAGLEAAQNIELSKNEATNSLASSGYNASSAVSYAILHATDAPEFNAADGTGSDCANFVSKCINAGGIPTSTSGKWYPATTWGNTNTAGVNWIRTGYDNETGVIIYFKGLNYISTVSSSSVSTGCIMFWNSTSHVAIVTYYDGSTIKYSQHSNVTKDSVYYTYTSENVTFYKFN